jgi:hypothetical protein
MATRRHPFGPAVASRESNSEQSRTLTLTLALLHLLSGAVQNICKQSSEICFYFWDWFFREKKTRLTTFRTNSFNKKKLLGPTRIYVYLSLSIPWKLKLSIASTVFNDDLVNIRSCFFFFLLHLRAGQVCLVIWRLTKSASALNSEMLDRQPYSRSLQPLKPWDIGQWSSLPLPLPHSQDETLHLQSAADPVTRYSLLWQPSHAS